MKAVIKSISTYLPAGILTNEMLSREFPEWSVEKITKKIGIKERRIAMNETVASMAIAASKLLFETSKLNPNEVDFIILCTQSPDYNLPTTACIIQSEIGVPTSAGAIDFNQGCSGYIYGLSIAKGLLVAGVAKNIILITADTYTKYLHTLDKANRSIFGDAATATWISQGSGIEIGDFVLGSDGNGANNLIVKNGGSKFLKSGKFIYPDVNGNIYSEDHLYMNGANIFNFTIENVPLLIDNTLKRNGVQFDQVRWYIFHQANAFILEHLRKKIGISIEKFPICLEKTGNTVSSSIPLVLEKLISDNSVKFNDELLLAGFGVGYSWGGVVLKNTFTGTKN